MQLSALFGSPKTSAPASSHSFSTHKTSARRNGLLRREARVGGAVFGPVPAGRTREFFCLDEYTWVWSEKWIDEKSGTHQQIFVRYEFTPHGVLKIVNEIPRGYVNGSELKNLTRAMKTYSERVKSEIYSVGSAAA